MKGLALLAAFVVAIIPAAAYSPATTAPTPSPPVETPVRWATPTTTTMAPWMDQPPWLWGEVCIAATPTVVIIEASEGAGPPMPMKPVMETAPAPPPPDLAPPLPPIVVPEDRLSMDCWNTVPNTPVVLAPLDRDAGAITLVSDSWGYLNGNVPAGTYRVTVERAGFHPFAADMTIDGQWMRVPLEPSTQSTDVLIVDENGRPIDGARVVLTPDFGERAEATAPAGQARFLVQSGRHSFEATAPGHMGIVAHRFVDGATVQIVLPTAIHMLRTVTGQVVTPDGRPVPGAQISPHLWDFMRRVNERLPMATQPDGSQDMLLMMTNAVADGQGNFQLVLPNESVWADVWADGHRHRTFVADPHATHIQVLLRPMPARDVLLDVRVVDAATGRVVPDSTLDVENVEWQSWECTRGRMRAGEVFETVARPLIDVAAPHGLVEPGWDHDCHVRERSDGVFSGELLPGRTIVRVRHDPWKSCDPCDFVQQFYANHARTYDIQPGGRLDIEVRLQPLARHQATVEGYVVDVASGAAVPHANVAFHGANGQYAYGAADADGSYRVRLAPGAYEVEAFADGFFRWVGTVEADANEAIQLDLPVLRDESWVRPCCDADREVRMLTDHGGMMDAPASEGAKSEAAGNLGPYDQQRRAKYLGGEDSQEPSDDAVLVPLPAVVALLALLGALLLLRRRL